MEQIMNTQWKNMFKVAMLTGALAFAGVSAQAQSITVKHDAKVDLGDVKAVDSVQGGAAVNGTNVDANVDQALGARVGSNKFTTSNSVGVSVPAAAVAAALAD
jgi:hypothetical protein